MNFITSYGNVTGILGRKWVGRHRNMLNRCGFTLVELLVVIAIIGVLIGLLVPAMQNMREVSRRSNCQFNLAEMSLALSAYDARFQHYPRGTIAESGPIRNVAEGYHHNWIEAILPMMDAQPIADAIDTDISVYAPGNREPREVRLPWLLCPSATDIRENSSCYAGIHASTEVPIDEDNDGVFLLNIPIRADDITDGLGYTLFLGEKLSRFEQDLGWISGTRSSLRNTGSNINELRSRIRGPVDPKLIVPPTFVGGLMSDHPGGAHVVMGSGETRFLSESTDLKLLQQLANRSDGALPIDNGPPIAAP